MRRHSAIGMMSQVPHVHLVLGDTRTAANIASMQKGGTGSVLVSLIAYPRVVSVTGGEVYPNYTPSAS